MNGETFPEQLSRVRQMAAGESETWDLSPNDHAALKAVIRMFDEMRTLLMVTEWAAHIDGGEYCAVCHGALMGDGHRLACRLQRVLFVVNA